MDLEKQIEEAAQKAETEEAKKTARIARGRQIEALLNSGSNTDNRCESLAIAEEMGADLIALQSIESAAYLSRRDTIKLPQGKYASLSRGRGWCLTGHKGRGEFIDGYIVGPGKYRVGSNDGYSRKSSEEWTVEHVRVGEKTWTIAN